MMTFSEREMLWAARMAKAGCKVARLERNGDVALYKTWHEREAKNNVWNTDIYYHIWRSGCWHRRLKDYREAVAVYDNLVKEAGK